MAHFECAECLSTVYFTKVSHVVTVTNLTLSKDEGNIMVLCNSLFYSLHLQVHLFWKTLGVTVPFCDKILDDWSNKGVRSW
jgi:hypothetical protein